MSDLRIPVELTAAEAGWLADQARWASKDSIALSTGSAEHLRDLALRLADAEKRAAAPGATRPSEEGA